MKNKHDHKGFIRVMGTNEIYRFVPEENPFMRFVNEEKNQSFTMFKTLPEGEEYDGTFCGWVSTVEAADVLGIEHDKFLEEIPEDEKGLVNDGFLVVSVDYFFDRLDEARQR